MNGNDFLVWRLSPLCSLLHVSISRQGRGFRWWGPIANWLVHPTKNPPGLVDIFNDKDGSGSRTWMNFGMLWLVFAGLLGFLGGWHNYDPTALASLASVGWS